MVAEIKICMGSACFARGNSENLDIIEKYINENNLEASIEVYGERCTDNCQKGPNIVINNKLYEGISKEELLQELRKLN